MKSSDKEIVFETSEKTAMTVNDKEAKVADLKGGMACCIYPRFGFSYENRRQGSLSGEIGRQLPAAI